MKVSLGEKAVLDISSDFAYGSQDVGGGLIPANSDLLFEVELLAINGLFNENESGLKNCSHCCNLETSPNQFNRCSACKKNYYCGR